MTLHPEQKEILEMIGTCGNIGEDKLSLVLDAIPVERVHECIMMLLSVKLIAPDVPLTRRNDESGYDEITYTITLTGRSLLLKDRLRSRLHQVLLLTPIRADESE